MDDIAHGRSVVRFVGFDAPVDAPVDDEDDAAPDDVEVEVEGVDDE